MNRGDDPIAKEFPREPGSAVPLREPTSDLDAERDKLNAAIDALSQREDGKQTLEDLHAFITDNGVVIGATASEQDAVLAILTAVWGPLRGEAVDTLGDSV